MPNVDSVSRVFIFILYLVYPMLTVSLECLSSSCILCAQCWQCLSIVCLHPVSCVPNVDIVSRLFIFILYLVYPMLTLSLDCLSSSCILCTQCWQCLSIVYLNPVSCVPNVDSVSRVFIFILYLVSQCWHCLSMVCLHPVSCVPNVDSVSRLFVFIMYLVYPMLTLSLDCLSSSCILCTQCWQCLSIVYLHPVSCVPNVDIVSRVFIFILYLVCPMLTLSLDCLSSSCILCTQCWQRLSIVCLHPVSCVPIVDIVSRLFIFILYLVCPMLTLSLECLSSSCILCAQCWHCLSIVYLHPVSCVPNVDSVSRLFIFILYLVYPMLTVSLDCLSSSCILCAQCWHCLSIVYLHPVSCVPNVDSVSRLFIFILYLVYPMLTVSLDCLSSSCILCAQCWHCLSSVYLHPVSCVPNVDSVSRLFIFILYLVYPMLTLSLDCLSSSCILCTQCWQCLSSVYLHPVSCVPMLTVSLECLSSSCILCAQCWQCLSIVCLHSVSCVPNVDIVSRLFIFILYLVCLMFTVSLECLSSSCILCTQCWQCLSSVCLHPVSCVPNVDSVSRLFVFILYLVYPMLTLSLDYLSSSCILCTQCWHCLSIIYLHPVSCVPNVDIVSRVFIFILYLVCPMLTLSLDCLSSSCILCTQCWHCLSIVYLHSVFCVPNVDSVSRLFIFILYLVCPMLTVSLDCLSSSCILCAQCWQCLSIVYLHPVSCVPNVDSVSRLFIFILYLVCPMLTLSLECLSSSCILCAQCWQCLSIVYLHPVSCVPNVDIVSRLFIFILYLVYPMLTVSLECLSSSCILCAQCWQCLSIVCLHPVSCVPNVDIVSRLFIFILYLVCLMFTVSLECLSSSCILWPNVDSVSRVFVFILYLVCPMLTVSLDCLSSSCILCTQCWHCLSIVYLHPVSCVPNVDIVSRLFIFILYLVYPMLTLSLDCLSSSCILCTQCWQCLSIVYLHPVSCVTNVNSVSRLFIFILYLVCPMLTVSLECLSSSCIFCAQCWHCLSIVYLHPVSCVPNVESVSRLFIFILYLVYPMLTASLDCFSSSCILCTQCWQCLSIIYLHPVSCVPNVDIVSRLFIFILYLVCPMLTLSLECLSSSCILCTQCWQRLSIVCLHPVSCVPNVDIVSRLFIFILYLVCPMLTLSLECLSSSCILCAQCWHCLSIVYLHPVSCVPNVDSVSRLFIFILYLVYPMLTVSLDCYLHPVSCVPNVDIVSRLFIFILYLVCPMLTLSLDCLSSSCSLCTQCWQCLSIVYLHPVSCVPNVDIVSRVFIFILYLVCPMLTVSLDCLSSSCILCTQCWQCLSIVYLHPVSCVPNVDIVSRLFIFILYLVCPMLTVSLDCLSSSCILCAQCWHCLSSVYLHPVSCVPNVDSVSRVFVFILYLVCPMLTVSLDCLSSFCILCTQCWQCLSIVYLHPVSCVPNVDSVSRVFIFILYLVYPMLTVSLECLSSSCILCAQCWQCLSIVCLHPVSCVPNVDIVSRLFIFILYLVYPMLTLSLDCLSSSCILCTQCWQCLSIVYLNPVSCVPNVDSVSRVFIFILYLVSQCWHCLSMVCLHPVSCVPNVDSVSRLFVFIMYLVYPMLTLSLDCLSSSCILCTQCWQCLSIVYLHPVSCVPNVDIVSRVFIFILYLVCPMLTLSLDCLSSSCILCTQCWQRLSIVCLHPVSCVPIVDIVSRLFIFILYLVCPMLTLSLECLSSSCILCANVDIVSRLFIFILYLVYPMLTVSLDCLSSSCILCTQCWQCLSIVYLHPVSCVPNVDIVSRLFIFILYLVCPMLTVSLDCLSSSCILCTQCWQCLSIVYLHPVSCVPNVDIVSRVFIFILYLVCPMLTVSLDCLSSSCILCTQCWHCLSIVYLHPVSCVPNVDSVSRVFIFILYLVSNVDSVSRVFVFILYLVCPMLTVSLDCLSSFCILCTQCWHCLSIVYLHPVSCVPNVHGVSRVFIFILYLVYPMLTVSLECLSSSCILCAQCWQCLSIVCLHPVSCVPNVDIVSRLFIFILYLVYPMLTLSLDYLSSSCILCAQCWHCLSSVYLHPVSCVPNVDIVSRLFIFILYLVYPMLTLSLDCLSSFCILCTQCWQCLSIVYLHPVSCVPNVDSVSRLFIFILYLVCPMLTVSLDCLSSSCILCTQCWQCLSIVYLHPVSCVPNVDIVSRVFIFILYLVCPMLTVSLDCLSSSCILCTQCWHCLSIVYLYPVSCVPNVDSVSRVFVFILYLVCPMLTVSLDCLSSSCILCTQCWHCLSIVYLHPVSCVPNVHSVSRVFIFILYLVTQCWQCLSSVCLHPVSCVPNVDSVSRLFVFILYLVYPMLTLSLDCLSSSCILCTQCWHCLSIVYLHPVSCVPNVDIVSRLFIFILYLVYPMLTVSLDCLSSSCILCNQC